ncbi:MAG: fibronectin type III domain-containing protein [Treponema sp.]|nr:fibronectin type III domain-containing protein [Treponema sp.]
MFVSSSVHAIGEKTLLLGGSSTWKFAEFRAGVTEVSSVRPHPVLVLSSAAGLSAAGYSSAMGTLGIFSPLTNSVLDLSISFDEGNPGLFRDSIGHYRITVSPELQAVDRRFARSGTGAALFGGNGPAGSGSRLMIEPEPRARNVLFAAGSHIRDFTIEFWLHPLNMENGEQILSWVSTRPNGKNYITQNIQCVSVKNRLQWSFNNFFTSPDGSSCINIDFLGDSPVIPKTWSHHLIRFDATTGMIEYLMNGRSECIAYATPAGRESSAAAGDVYTPVAGNGGVFIVGERYTGLLDEFRIHNACISRSFIQKYVTAGGRVETGAIDLGEYDSAVLKIEASGGCTNIKGSKINSDFIENGRFRFSDDSEMQFFIRAGDNPFLLKDSNWITFTPGADINDNPRGRYVQVAVDFYPSADGETTPYLDELRIIYLSGEPPLPPRNLTAVAVDGGVMLRWKNSPSSDTAGYLVYYSSVRGELFGDDAALGKSPIDVGNKISILIDGLKNGTLYYFQVAAYDRVRAAGYNTGEFSKEVTGRPLAGLLAEDR